MKEQYRHLRSISVILILSLLIFQPFVSAEDTNPPTITLQSPEKTLIPTKTPTISIDFEDENGIDTNSIQLKIDLVDVTTWELTKIKDNNITYKPSGVFTWDNGNHTVELTVADSQGNMATETWTFEVNTSLRTEESGFNIFFIVQLIVFGTIIAFAAIGAYILYLKKTKNFTFEKFFAQHPIKKEFFVIYIPVLIAFLFTMLSLLYVTSTPGMSPFANEYVLIIGFFIAVAPYAIDAQLERKKTVKYEQAYSQLLFELADAMRGGLDPTKAIIELSSTDTSIISDNLRSAADNIRLGRPFDHVMQAMAKTIKSDLVKRYARLIGDTSKIGGEPAQVIHRAAKDMDDFLKVGEERRRQLFSQATTIYIAFGVMLIVLYQLINMFPTLGGIDISLLSGGVESAAEGSSVDRMSFLTIKKRFFDLLLINSIGTGTIIGSFIDGHIKFGLVHSIVLSIVSTIFFVVMII